MKVKSKVPLFFCIFYFVFTNCNKSKILNKEEYYEYINDKDNGLISERIINNVKYTLFYLPCELQILKQSTNSKISKIEYDKKVNEISGSNYYLLKIEDASSTGGPVKNMIFDKDIYGKSQLYINMQMQKDIITLSKHDSIPCSLFHFENPERLTYSLKFNLAFDTINNNKEKTIILYDQLFNNGFIKFNFSEKDLNNIPELNFF